MMLTHEQGVLSALLSKISSAGRACDHYAEPADTRKGQRYAVVGI